MSDQEEYPRLFIFDLESTGTDPLEDRIVEIAYMELFSLSEVTAVPANVARVNPGVPIPEEASEIHGITDEDVESCPPFDAVAPALQKYVDEADFLVHYNGRTFDTLMLDAELRRADQPGIDLEDVREIDLYRIWCELEPRSLAGAVRRFVGEDAYQDFDAHSAKDDTHALLPVLQGLASLYTRMEGENGTYDDLAALSVPDGEVDRSGKLRRREDGTVVFNFGQKNYGDPVLDNWDYAEWMLGADFPADTKAALRELLRERDESLTGRDLGGKG